MNHFGLGDENFLKLVSIFQEFPSVTRVQIFGSRALGRERPGSDIDLAIEGVKLDLPVLHLIREAYEKLYLPWKLDLVDLAEIDQPELKEHISRCGIEVFKR